MKKLLFTITICLFSLSLLTQSCLPEGIEFTSQEQIDNFQIDNPNCTEIEGNVTIGKWPDSNIKNLNGLSAITSIGGRLTIHDTDSLLNLSGLDSIDSIGDGLFLYGNHFLQNLTGLNNVTSINGWILLEFNESLESLSGLEGLTSVDELFVGASDSSNISLVSLSGLNNVTHIEKDVRINGNCSLLDLSGLENLITIGGTLEIASNESLSSLDGLDNLTFVGKSLMIGGWSRNAMPFASIECHGNPSLTSISALSNLTSIGGSLGVYCNDALLSLTGLESLDTIGSLLIGYAVDNDFEFGTAGNSSLASLTGLDGLTRIGSGISITGNSGLTNLTGLNNELVIDGSLKIRFNGSLSNCETQSICDYLVNPNGSVEIHHNATGCNSPVDLADVCGIEVPCLPYGNYYFFKQSDVDNFQDYYPGCTDLEGDVVITGKNNITNLMGLSELNSISGYLHIGSWEIVCNPLLMDLSGLEGLTSVEGLEIILNDTLSSLTGLDNIEPATMTYLTIWGNQYLSSCDVKSICNYLVAPNGELNLHGNAPGCNSTEEVLDSCDFSSVTIHDVMGSFSIRPNPFSNSTTIEYELKQPEHITLTIYDYLGKQVYQIQVNQPHGKQQLIWNAEKNANGIYHYRLQVGNDVANGKMVKVR